MISGIKHESIKQPIPLCNNCPPCSHRPIVKFLRSILFSGVVETVTEGGKDFSYSHARTALCSAAEQPPLASSGPPSKRRAADRALLRTRAAIKRQDKGRHAMAAPIFPSLFVF